VKRITPFRRALTCAALSLLLARVLFASPAQQSPTSSPTDAKPPETPAQIELLETHIRFEANGDSRKEVHTRVRINNELGVRQFSRLTFDYNRSFQQIEIPLVHITHASGGTADILPGAISDQPNPAVASAPAYEDVRVKSVRILGLSPSDILEYRVVTTTTHHPLAPDFWLEHNFDRSGVVSQEAFEIDLPASRQVQLRTNPATPVTSTEKSGEGGAARTLYRWHPEGSSSPSPPDGTAPVEADIVLTTFASWDALSARLAECMKPSPAASKAVSQKADELAGSLTEREAKLESIYNFVSRKIATVDLPLGITGFRTLSPAQTLSAGYGTSEDKFALFYGLASRFSFSVDAALPGERSRLSNRLPRPSALTSLIVLTELPGPTAAADHGRSVVCDHCTKTIWLVPDVEVAPFGMILASQRGKQAVIVRNSLASESLRLTPRELPFAARQMVRVDATLATDGTLNAKVHYTLRGDNELLLRVAFHQSPREKWKDVAQLLALSDGFRGKIVSASASDPSATKQPFTIDYEIAQPKFVDWSKKPVRIPALLPALGVPDPPAKSESGASAPIELGTPLNVDTKLTLHLPAGASALSPTGTSVERDYATFVSHYAAEGNVVFASRHINFILREVSATRTVDYNAFLHAVQTDQSQLFTLNPPAALQPAASKP
jgi:hypothetical protein